MRDQTRRDSWKLHVIWTAHKSQLLDHGTHNSCSRGVCSFGMRRSSDSYLVTDVSKRPVGLIFKGQTRFLKMYGGVKVILYSFLAWHQFDMNHQPLFRPINSGKWFLFVRFRDQIYLTLKSLDFTSPWGHLVTNQEVDDTITELNAIDLEIKQQWV
jgi:hypothetical protein